MNAFQKIYCNQYIELKPRGKGEAAHFNGNLLVSVMLMMWSIGTFFLVIFLFPEFGNQVEQELASFVGPAHGRIMGRLLGLIFIGLLFLGVRLTIGSQQRFVQTIKEFESFSEAKQKTVAKQGMRFMAASFGWAAVGLGLSALLT